MSFLLFSLLLINDVQIKQLSETSDLEIAAIGRVRIEELNPSSKFKACVPIESKPFSLNWEETLKTSIFRPKELRDLMACQEKKCAFNFLPEEVARLAGENTEEGRKRLYQEFFKNRTQGLTGLDPRKETNFIQRADVWEVCRSKELESLLTRRPLKGVGYRMSHVIYDDRMRPTTRLLQGVSFETTDAAQKGTRECYAEALIFADHYDVDRVEVWSLNREQKELTLEIRHRVDLLNTWVRRLNKGAFRSELKKLVKNQLKTAKSCLETK